MKRRFVATWLIVGVVGLCAATSSAESAGQPQTEAIAQCREAAEQGDAEAQFALGRCYYSGHGVEQSYTESVRWYRKAAEQGFAEAQYNLGACYYSGHGVEQSTALARQWFLEAARRGNIRAAQLWEALE